MTASFNTCAVTETLDNATRRLLSRRVDGHWSGELSSSALSTATAVLALLLADRAGADSRADSHPTVHQELVRHGLDWLLQTQNRDGGWGDTVQSFSNISTTCLCWAALSVAGDARQAGDDRQADRCARAAESWLRQAAGSLDPAALVEAVVRRYGKDRTFSVPILTTLAVAAKLGPGRSGWRRVPQLPFELAACPHQWFKWLRLPVVSYALPALIAIGQARHHQCPTRNLPARLLRRLTRRRTLRVLEGIQPASGGFLEAVPLTSFVVMSLLVSGSGHHPVVRRGVEFLRRSARADGSWPIDTNLATWATTLAVNALHPHPDFGDILPLDERRQIRDWLLAQQYREEHPYTHAAPGGWAWTDLPGGVPDADDTAGALFALHHLDLMDDTAPGEAVLEAAAAGVAWLLDLQNRDGGLPTFCRGWGALPFDRSGADLTAHALLAWQAWQPHLPPELALRVTRGTARGINYLARAQRKDGAWVPLWFGNQAAPDEENPTYGTARVLPALWGMDKALDGPLVRGMRRRGLAWLLAAQNEDGGWGGDKSVTSSIEETALALHALGAAVAADTSEVTGGDAPSGDAPSGDAPSGGELLAAAARGVAWLIENTDRGRHFPASPIGFYFARLWYFEELYPLIFTVGALARWAGLSK